ncbi:hypothetical protein [Bacteroides sp.]|nr:hypothetical protein [Bacteroides sp.]
MSSKHGFDTDAASDACGQGEGRVSFVYKWTEKKGKAMGELCLSWG